MTQSAATSG